MSLDGPYGSKLKLRVVEDTVKNNIFQDVPLPANTNIRVVKWARNQIALVAKFRNPFLNQIGLVA